MQEFDALIMVTPQDYLRLERHYLRLSDNLPARRVLFVGNAQVGGLVAASGLGGKVGFVCEEDILPFAKVHEVVGDILRDILRGQELPRGITGWYYQQFLKMQYARVCRDDYYLVWDGDTIPCKPFSMFCGESGTPYLDLKMEYREEYFVTLSKLFPGMGKCMEKSFISEHMLMHCGIMKQMLAEIEDSAGLAGETFWEKILRAVGIDNIQESSFSEFETYGTYAYLRHPGAYCLRDWHSFRLAGAFFDPDTISERDFAWLAKDFAAVSFEKGHFVREDHKNLFDNVRYQEKLSARQMLEIAQQEFLDGYLEVW